MRKRTNSYTQQEKVEFSEDNTFEEFRLFLLESILYYCKNDFKHESERNIR